MSTDTKSACIRIVAECIANARGMRRGIPPITNILDLLPDKLRAEVMDDADMAVSGLLAMGYTITGPAAEEAEQ